MILQKLILSNFRQFKAKQEIEFAYPSEGKEAKISVFYGDNGRGKTGIFRAIMFCLFGERRLSQDGDIPGSELKLVNTLALEQAQGKEVEAFVELVFSHKKSIYQLKRTVLGLFDNGDMFEEIGEIKLAVTRPDGNTEIIDPSEVSRVIASILDPRVKDYFLFDGEQIEHLTRASAEQRKEISRGIRNLLKVDALETAIKATSRLTIELEKEVKKYSTPNLARLIQKLQNNEEVANQKTQRLEDIAGEEIKANAEIKYLDQELDKIKEIRSLLDQRKGQEEVLKDLDQKFTDLLSEMKCYSGKIAPLLVSSTVNKVFQYINNQKKRGEIPSEIRKDLIERILADHECICGNEINEGTEAHKNITQWLKKTADHVVQDSALNLWRYLSEAINRFSDDGSKVQSKLLLCANFHNEIDKRRESIDNLKQQIGDTKLQNVLGLENQREFIQKKLFKLDNERMLIRQNLAELSEEKTTILISIENEKREQARGIEFIARASLARGTLDALKNVHKEFTEEIKDLISQQATCFLGKFLDLESKKTLRKIVVNDDYSLQILDRWDNPFLANISAGQRQIMSIAFIIALAEVASQGQLLEIPLFMDTPLGRLSSEHRRNLINKLPLFSSQWVLLATDTEFTKREARLLKKSNKWGSFYMLKPDGDGNTIIQRENVDNAIALLKDEGEEQ